MISAELKYEEACSNLALKKEDLLKIFDDLDKWWDVDETFSHNTELDSQQKVTIIYELV